MRSKTISAIILVVPLSILVLHDVYNKQSIEWISTLHSSPSNFANPYHKKQELFTEEHEEQKNYEYFARALDCRYNNSYQNQNYKKKAMDFLSNEQIISRCSDCSSYFNTINSNGFAPITQEEMKTPLAFSYTVHKDIGVLEMFLSLYFRPTDAHCIHVDAKADPKIFKTVLSIVNCYNEVFPESLVFMPRQVVPVFWGTGGSTLEADFVCYRELMARSNKWKVVGNVAGTELPFVSIQRFRQKLKDSNGFSINLSYNINLDRVKHYWEMER